MTSLKNLQTKSDQNTHHFKKNSWRSMPPNPPSKAQSDMQISKSEKNNSWSPSPKSWVRPCITPVSIKMKSDLKIQLSDWFIIYAVPS